MAETAGRAAAPPDHSVAGTLSAEAPRRNWKRFFLRLLGSAVLLTVLFLVLPLDQLWDALSRVTALTWFVAIGTYLCLHSVGAMKWRMVVNTAGAGITPLQAIRFYYAGLFGNTFLPSIVGGDMVRAGLALRYARSRAGLLLGSIVDRGIDII
ncbi:MAG: lysylphosphatidylglycerol synthase domain-containing protein, partial [Gemmatimonadota bacterium]